MTIKKRNQNTFLQTKGCTLLGAVLAMALVGCDDDDHDHEELDAADDACEHMADGPAMAIAAAAEATGAPSVSAPHRRYDIALDANGEGYVSFEADEDGEFHFFVDDMIGLAVMDGTTPVPVEETLTSVSECGDVEMGWVFDLEPGEYALHFTGGDTEIRMVPVEGGEHDH